MAATQKSLVVCDDDEAIVEAIKIILEDNNYTVYALTHGNALEMVRAKQPDVVLIDISMVGADGSVVVKQMKADTSFKNIPVIICSANVKIEKIAKECGADDYLAKPFDIKDLLAVVKKHSS